MSERKHEEELLPGADEGLVVPVLQALLRDEQGLLIVGVSFRATGKKPPRELIQN